MNKKTLLFAFVISIATTLPSCKTDCEEQLLYHYENIELAFGVVPTYLTSTETYDLIPLNTSEEIINTFDESFSFQVKQLNKKVSLIENNNYYWNNPFNINAYAACVEGNPWVYTDPIISVKIYSNNDFNDEYLAGDNLVDMFKVLDDFNMSLDEANDLATLSRVGQDGDQTSQIVLTKLPIASQIHTFSVEVNYQSGRNYRFNSKEYRFIFEAENK